MSDLTTPLDQAWKELIATAMRRNVVVAVGEHRTAVEAAVRAELLANIQLALAASQPVHTHTVVERLDRPANPCLFDPSHQHHSHDTEPQEADRG